MSDPRIIRIVGTSGVLNLSMNLVWMAERSASKRLTRFPLATRRTKAARLAASSWGGYSTLVAFKPSRRLKTSSFCLDTALFLTALVRFSTKPMKAARLAANSSGGYSA